MNQPAKLSFDMGEKITDRARRNSDKREAKKAEIAASALNALTRLGYANTTMRDIARMSEMSLGSLSYYFTGKQELIVYCVRQYKRAFSARIRQVIWGLEGRDAVVDGLAAALTTSIIEDRAVHRLWYDIRAQSMFDSGFSEITAELDAKMEAIVAQAMRAAGLRDTSNAFLAYAMLEGLFRALMQGTDEGRLDRPQVNAILRSSISSLFRPDNTKPQTSSTL